MMTPVLRAAIARLAVAADLPLRGRCRRLDFLDRSAAEIGQRDDDDLAAGFGAHVVDDA